MTVVYLMKCKSVGKFPTVISQKKFLSVLNTAMTFSQAIASAYVYVATSLLKKLHGIIIMVFIDK